MKKTYIYRILICVALVFVVVVNMTGCSPKVAKVGDLMEGIQVESISRKEPDEAFINSQMRMSVDLFKNISTGKDGVNKNVLISPLSIQLALAMTANGADGQTRQEMEQLLCEGFSIEKLNEYLNTYVSSLSSDEFSKINFANSIWIRGDDSSFGVNKDFLQINANYYNAAAYKELFNSETVEKINNWVKNKTEGEIVQIVDDINPNTMMFLVNTLLFDANWRKTYEKQFVRDDIFTSINEEKDTVKMMSSTEYGYLDDGKATGFRKEYETDKYSFVALMPNKSIDIYEYINGLTGESLLKMLRTDNFVSVHTKLPAFKSTYEINLNNALTELGMPSAFDWKMADFSRIEPTKSLFIGETVHKTSIEVNRFGTKAGASSSVEMITLGVGTNIKKRVYLNRPFVYMIVDNSTNLPIFMGTVVDL